MNYSLYIDGTLIDDDLTHEDIFYWENNIMSDLDDHEVFLIVASEDGKYVSHSESFLMNGTLYRMVQYPYNNDLYMQVIPLKEESK